VAAAATGRSVTRIARSPRERVYEDIIITRGTWSSSAAERVRELLRAAPGGGDAYALKNTPAHVVMSYCTGCARALYINISPQLFPQEEKKKPNYIHFDV